VKEPYGLPIVGNRAVAVTVALLLAAAVALLGVQECRRVRYVRSDAYGPLRFLPRRLRAFEATGAGGGVFHSSGLRGKSAVFVFMDSTEESMALARRAARVFESRAVRDTRLLAVMSSRAFPRSVSRGIGNSKVVRLLLDIDGVVARSCCVRRFPAVVMVTPGKMIVEVLLKPTVDDLDEAWAERIEALGARRPFAHYADEKPAGARIRRSSFHSVGGVRELVFANDVAYVRTSLGDVLPVPKPKGLGLRNSPKIPGSAPDAPAAGPALRSDRSPELPFFFPVIGPQDQLYTLRINSGDTRREQLALLSEGAAPLWSAWFTPGRVMAGGCGKGAIVVATPDGYVGWLLITDSRSGSGASRAGSAHPAR